MPIKVCSWWRTGLWWKAKHSVQPQVFILDLEYSFCTHFHLMWDFLKPSSGAGYFHSESCKLVWGNSAWFTFFNLEKSRLISLTDSGCLVIFHLLKWSSPQWWLVFALMPYLLKYKINSPNFCLRPGGGAWSCCESFPQFSKWECFPFVSGFSCYSWFSKLEQPSLKKGL